MLRLAQRVCFINTSCCARSMESLPQKEAIRIILFKRKGKLLILIFNIHISSGVNPSPTFLPHVTHLTHTLNTSLNKIRFEAVWSEWIFLSYCKSSQCTLHSETGQTGSWSNFLSKGCNPPQLLERASLIAAFAATSQQWTKHTASSSIHKHLFAVCAAELWTA